MAVLNDVNSGSSDSLFTKGDCLEDNVDEARIDPGEKVLPANIAMDNNMKCT